jgi:hypothetical protein
LVKEIKSQLSTQAKASHVDVARLEKRAAELDREVGRLVKAIRTIDAAELVEELQIVRAERDRIRAELAQAGKFTDALDLDAEAERIADTMLDLGEQLTDAAPGDSPPRLQPAQAVLAERPAAAFFGRAHAPAHRFFSWRSD